MVKGLKLTRLLETKLKKNMLSNVTTLDEEFEKAKKSKGQDKVHTVMSEFKHGHLHSGRGKKGKKGKIVTDRQQAIAIALSEAGLSKGDKMRTFTKSQVVEFLRNECGYGQESSEKMADLVFKARIKGAKDKNKRKKKLFKIGKTDGQTRYGPAPVKKWFGQK